MRVLGPIVQFFGWLTKATPGCKRHDWCRYKGRYQCSVCSKVL